MLIIVIINRRICCHCHRNQKKTLIRQSICPGRLQLSERFFLDHVAEEEGTYIAFSNTLPPTIIKSDE